MDEIETNMLFYVQLFSNLSVGNNDTDAEDKSFPM